MQRPPPVANPLGTQLPIPSDNIAASFSFGTTPAATDGTTKTEKFGMVSPEGGQFMYTFLSERKTGTIPTPIDRTLSEDLDNYFSGPLDPTLHSKLPYYLRMRGSILPVMILPIMFVAVWATAITAICHYGYYIAFDSVLLTVLGFVVGMSLSFRSATAYERYIEGRKFWQQLILHSRNLARIIWIHARERSENEEQAKDDLLAKLTAMNLILAFAQSVKHRLRHEIEYDYADLKPLINNLNTFAKTAQCADTPAATHNKYFRKVKTWGQYLGIPFCKSNPRKAIKNALREGKHHGNLPFEIMVYLAAYIEHVIVGTKTLTHPCWQTQVSASQLAMMDAYGGCERVLKTPLPLAYSIAISQITWIYVLFLPFQLYPKLKWVTVPGTVVAAYIILGLAAIGREIENPFGRDVNDLGLGRYCSGLQRDLNVLTSQAPPKSEQWMMTDDNMPLWPYTKGGWGFWKGKSIDEIRIALANKIDDQSARLATKPDSSERTDELPGIA